METNTQLQKQEMSLTFLTPTQIQKYQDVDMAVAELINSKMTGMALTFAKVTVVEKIELVLDAEFMAKVMNLKNKEYGFKTDEKAGENYSEAKVKPAIVQAMLFGAEITGNEFNILGGNCYLTKNFCKNWLRKNRIWYKLLPSMSRKTDSGHWVVNFVAEWLDFEGGKHKETVDIPVNKHEKSAEATIRGQAERDMLAYIIEDLRKESLPMDKMEDFVVDANYEEIKPKYQAQPNYNPNVQPEVTKQQVVGVLKDSITDNQTSAAPVQNATNPNMVDDSTQKEFDTFIDNKKKVTDIQTLTNRAKAFCADKGIGVAQLSLTTFNEIKFKIENGQWL